MPRARRLGRAINHYRNRAALCDHLQAAMDFTLRMASFWISASGGTLALLGAFIPAMAQTLFPGTMIVAGAAALLFLRILFSRPYRQGIDAANAEMRANYPWPGQARIPGDRDWGLFGRRAGPPALLWLRAILVIGILQMAVLENTIGSHALWLWFASTFVAMQLSIMHGSLSSQPR